MRYLKLIAAVSHEAADTGRHAVDPRDSMAVPNHAVEELRHSLIKEVRTSTAEVDRRQIWRDTVEIAGRLSIADHNTRSAPATSP